MQKTADFPEKIQFLKTHESLNLTLLRCVQSLNCDRHCLSDITL
jgi:hypothetical protein